jgi:hypothetical protein
MATTVKQAFQEFSSNLEITDRQTKLVSERWSNVVSALKAELSLHSEESKLIGSYARHTLTRYLSEADVDVMVILHYGDNEDWDSAEGAIKALDKFRAILDEAYPHTDKRRDRNCITMKFSEFRLDVVPAFQYEQGYYEIPDSIRKEWVPTNPSSFAGSITDVNKAMDGSFVPLIKMVKAWNREVGWPIASFHLECLMYNRYHTYEQGYTYHSMLKVFFKALPGYLSKACYDPIMGDRVDTYLDNEARKTRREVAIEKAKAAAAASKEAYEDQDDEPSVAIDKWKSLLGEFFPSYG